MEFPNKIACRINIASGTVDTIGLSDASVYLFEDMVLKVQPNSTESDNEYQMIEWLQGKLPVPQIIEYEKTNKYSYLLMRKCEGLIGCSDVLISQQKCMFRMLGEALEWIWSVKYGDCPCNNRLDRKLSTAEQNVIDGKIDIARAEPGTFGKNSFRDPETLLQWLKNNKPTEELALSHGDFCLPNILFKNGKLSGLIDLGKAGVSDKWCDIALCYRSMKNNLEGRYHGTTARSFDASEFFDGIGLKPDWDKIRYYILLDELF